jgi:hypothetical protein
VPTHIDIPSLREMEWLVAARSPGSVSIYLPTDPTGQNSDAERIDLSNLAAEALEQLDQSELARSALSAIELSLGDLIDDDEYWRYQARTLAIFVDEERLMSYRLPNQLSRAVAVSDRFHIKPLLRTFTFPQAAFVLAVSLNAVRLIEASPDLPADRVDVPDLPSDAASAIGRSSIKDTSHYRRVGGSEGRNLRIRQYARQINRALALVLSGHDLPLVLAGTDPVVSIYRSVNSYPRLIEETISGNPDTKSDVELVAAVRPILDRLYALELADLHETFGSRQAQGRATSDMADVARASTIGAVDTLFVDIEQSVPGTVDEETGRINTDSPSSETYGVTDEIVRRVLRSSGRVLAVRGEEVPGGGPVAALLRFPLT